MESLIYNLASIFKGRPQRPPMSLQFSQFNQIKMDFNLIFLFALNLNLISRFVLAQPFPFLIISPLLWLLIWFYAKERQRGNITNGTWSFPSHFLILFLFLPCKKGWQNTEHQQCHIFLHVRKLPNRARERHTHHHHLYLCNSPKRETAVGTNCRRFNCSSTMYAHISMCVLTGYFAGVVSSRDFGCVLSVRFPSTALSSSSTSSPSLCLIALSACW